MTNKTFYIFVITLLVSSVFLQYINIKANQAESDKYAKNYQCQIVQHHQTHVFEDCVLVNDRIVKITFNGVHDEKTD